MAAQELDKGIADLTGEYILTFHAIELGLKAFLITQGLSAEVLRRKPYRHDLTSLYRAAKQHGISLNFPGIEETLDWINEWHGDGVRIRYEFACPRTLPMCATLFPWVAAIIMASK